jgi:hypothetical protein
MALELSSKSQAEFSFISKPASVVLNIEFYLIMAQQVSFQ